jgi:hypothetical protein
VAEAIPSSSAIASFSLQPVGEFTLKGFRRPVAGFNVLEVRETAARLEPA